MKKRIMMGITALSMVIILSGCGSNGKKLTCTQTSESNGFKSEEKQVYTLKNNKVTTLKEERTITLSGDMAEYLEEHKTNAQNIVEAYENVSGITAKTSSSSNSVTVTIEYDAKTMDGTYKDSANINESYESLKEIKKGQGYECK